MSRHIPAAVWVTPLIVCIALGGISGCSAQGQPESAPTFPSAEEQTKLYNDCMESRGWSSTELADGTYDYEFSDAQRPLFTKDSDECTQQIGVSVEPVLTDDQWKDFYDRQLLVAECLAGLGVDMPEPPSFQTWMGDGRVWGPYGDVPPDVIAARFDELQAACPPLDSYQ